MMVIFMGFLRLGVGDTVFFFPNLLIDPLVLRYLQAQANHGREHEFVG